MTIDLTLIPFGFREEHGLFVDVSHVERGRKCDCICPSCKTPLIARQGKIKQWHFAHASRAVYEQTDKECEYSFFVSVRLMARQVVGNSLQIKLPTYEGIAYLDAEEVSGDLTEKFIVANEQRVIIENIEAEKVFCGVAVDVYGNINGYPFVLYFTHPGRAMPGELKSPEVEKCGVVEVSLKDTYSLFVGDRGEKQSYLERLRHFLVEDMQSKRWVFHPRYKDIHARTILSLEARRNELLQHLNVKCNPNPKIEIYSDLMPGKEAIQKEGRREVKYQCVMCDATWIGVEPGYSPCPKCHTHLYAKCVGYFDNENLVSSLNRNKNNYS